VENLSWIIWVISVRGPKLIYGALYRRYLWEPNNMENIWVIYVGNIYVSAK